LKVEVEDGTSSDLPVALRANNSVEVALPYTIEFHITRQALNVDAALDGASDALHDLQVSGYSLGSE